MISVCGIGENGIIKFIYWTQINNLLTKQSTLKYLILPIRF